MSRFKVTHTYPEITREENEEIQREILLKMYKLFNKDIQSNISDCNKSKKVIK